MTYKSAFQGFRSLMYRSGRVYNFISNKIYDIKRKYLTISKLIGKNKHVLDLACGTGFLTRFIHPSNIYEGWDINHKFLKKLKKDWKHGKSNIKHLIVKQKDLFNFHEYPDEKVDVIVLCDILHHINPLHFALVENAKIYARKVIICEPIAVKPKDIKANTRFIRIFVRIGRFFPEKLYKLIDFLFLDNDGVNSYKKRLTWNHNNRSIKTLYSSMGFEKIYKIKDNYIGVWDSNN
ncbi:MAG: class I SAM-dependent methyltransferase [Promethearchaeota archaeon]